MHKQFQRYSASSQNNSFIKRMNYDNLWRKLICTNILSYLELHCSRVLVCRKQLSNVVKTTHVYHEINHALGFTKWNPTTPPPPPPHQSLRCSVKVDGAINMSVGNWIGWHFHPYFRAHAMGPSQGFDITPMHLWIWMCLSHTTTSLPKNRLEASWNDFFLLSVTITACKQYLFLNVLVT